MITTFEGVMGSGKTLTAVALACSEHYQNGRKIISNIHLAFPYQKFDTQFFLDHLQDQQLNNCITLLDEAGQYLDARRSGGRANLLWSYYVVQTRKRGVDLYACFHHYDVMDKRFRRQIDIRGSCRYLKEDPCTKCKGEKILDKGRGVLCPACGSRNGEGPNTECKFCKGTGEVCPRCLGYGVTGWATTKFIDLNTGRRSRIRVFGPAFFGQYDTEELVPFTGKQLRIAPEDL
jgi:hypothetical protein